MQDFFSPLSDFFFWILRFLHENAGVSWAWAIVLLTLIVRIVLIPLTWRQIKSMRAMQALQPQLKELQQKYQNDRQMLNQKMMEFYRANNVSPFGSCLPLLLQMPVFLGLFYMLREAGQAIFWDKGGSSWLIPPDVGAFASVWHSSPVGWLWINDITGFDYALMFLYIGTQFVASWQTARKGAGQQKTIAYFMPVIIGVFMYIYKWPAGLFIYWVTSNLWTIAQQIVLEKVVPAPVAVAPAATKGKPGAGRPTGAGPAKAPGKAATPGKQKAIPAQTPQKAGTSTKQKTTPTQPAGKTPPKPPGKSGGKTSGQQTGQQGKTAGSKSQRTDGGTGGPKSPGRT